MKKQLNKKILKEVKGGFTPFALQATVLGLFAIFRTPIQARIINVEKGRPLVDIEDLSSDELGTLDQLVNAFPKK